VNAGLLCSFYNGLSTVIWIYTLILLAYAVVSWLPDLRGRWTMYLAMLVEPLLTPLRRIIPPMGGFDLSFLVVILIINFVVRPLVAHLAFNACYF
jgi:YggT family protein